MGTHEQNRGIVEGNVGERVAVLASYLTLRSAFRQPGLAVRRALDSILRVPGRRHRGRQVRSTGRQLTLEGLNLGAGQRLVGHRG